MTIRAEIFNSPWAYFTENEREIILIAFAAYHGARTRQLESTIAEETFQSLMSSLREIVNLDYEFIERRIEQSRASQSWAAEDAAKPRDDLGAVDARDDRKAGPKTSLADSRDS